MLPLLGSAESRFLYRFLVGSCDYRFLVVGLVPAATRNYTIRIRLQELTINDIHLD